VTSTTAAPGGGALPGGSPDPAADRYPGLGRVLVVVPTYNEAENVAGIVARVAEAVPCAHVLVADDASPDGTGEIADELADGDARVNVLHRRGKQGLGTAYIAGFRWAHEAGYDVVVEMDADGSHAPEELPRLLDALRGTKDGTENGTAPGRNTGGLAPDVVLGSRWVRGGTVVNWPKRRELLSRGANLYTKLALGLPLGDATGGFRAYRLSVLESLDLDSVASQGYCFQVDLAWRAWRAGYRVVEVPITFTDRERGQSKMSTSIVREALWRVTAWGVRHRLAAAREALRGGR
jgi:dolichol-phosphate mannosyltransferase